MTYFQPKASVPITNPKLPKINKMSQNMLSGPQLMVVGPSHQCKKVTSTVDCTHTANVANFPKWWWWEPFISAKRLSTQQIENMQQTQTILSSI